MQPPSPTTAALSDEFAGAEVSAPARQPPVSERMGLIMSEPERPDALARLDVFVGEWALEARFPGATDGTAASYGAMR